MLSFATVYGWQDVAAILVTLAFMVFAVAMTVFAMWKADRKTEAFYASVNSDAGVAWDGGDDEDEDDLDNEEDDSSADLDAYDAEPDDDAPSGHVPIALKANDAVRLYDLGDVKIDMIDVDAFVGDSNTSTVYIFSRLINIEDWDEIKSRFKLTDENIVDAIDWEMTAYRKLTAKSV